MNPILKSFKNPKFLRRKTSKIIAVKGRDPTTEKQFIPLFNLVINYFTCC